MKIGGYAHKDGITFFNNIFKVKATYYNNRVDYDIQWILPPRWLRKVSKIPFLNGILIFFYQWKIINKKIRVVFCALTFLLILDLIFNFMEPFRTYEVWIYIMIGIVSVLNHKSILKILKFHGAEHKIINCYSEKGYIDINEVEQSSRFNKKCGSNLVTIFLILYVLTSFLKINYLIFYLFLLIVALQITKYLSKMQNKFLESLNILQYITVREPSLFELEVGIQGFNKLLQVTAIYNNEQNKRKI
ncbi:DUF1385 domain-containing protein [Serpentinicella sp. ANB-PHB4]|uniref:DUF1385 domain-containing protein n=1 Tax=Serpentinicella sp. ANB-PHB4 TaxID=3074076 RepID=UPI0028584F94|nr:DUF1385 domain-containing protein [Serpentinicella sp. ANB-PHB4]MDR5659420.1 DUF1385 domain-containing protein [Serpentinicella sp. ANB-PHB4]